MIDEIDDSTPSSQVTGQPLEVAETQVFELSELREPEYNPNRMTPSQRAELLTSMQKFGVVEDPVVNIHPDRYGIIVGGAHRVAQAIEAGQQTLPCKIVSIENVEGDSGEKELNLRLNGNRGKPQAEILREYFTAGDLMSVGYGEEDLRDWNMLTTEAAAELQAAAQPGGPANAAADVFGQLAEAAADEVAASGPPPSQPAQSTAPPPPADGETPSATQPTDPATSPPQPPPSPAAPVTMRTIVISGRADQIDPVRKRLDELRQEIGTDLADALYRSVMGDVADGEEEEGETEQGSDEDS